MSDLMREEFERQMTEDMVSKLGEGFRSSVALFFIDREPNGDYSNPIPYAGWWAWQASRECLVINLEPDDPDDEGAAYLHQDFVKERIQSLGLKVKP
ncbi:MAG: hypothetical protein [Bacteriophage sp.]|nr:MAG: hypothetical protein [Bacteriophage sp.]